MILGMSTATYTLWSHRLIVMTIFIAVTILVTKRFHIESAQVP
jgi:hypothetical protein